MKHRRNISNQQIFEKCKTAGNILLDVRTAGEWVQGIAQGAHCLCLSDLVAEAQKQLDKNNSYYVMCQTGRRSLDAIEQLQKLGFTKLYNANEGYSKWQIQGLPTEIPEISDHDIRYARHHQLQGFGKKAQQKLKTSHVLLVGAGGLGSASALYLAAAGVGKMTIIDDDTVELSNLQRQIIHTTQAIGTLKVDSAKQTLHQLNPNITVNVVAEKLNQSNATPLIKAADIVIDGSDNLSTRYLINKICLQLKKPLLYATVFQYEAQLSTFDFRQQNAACLNCLFPQTQGFEPENCSNTGVLGVTPGLAGIYQATEALKLLTNIGTTLTNKLQIIDLLHNRFTTFNFKKSKHCILH